MNEVGVEAERWRPGVCHHEAAHAVYAYRIGHEISHVQVGELSECVHRPRAGKQYSNTEQLITVALVGKYAESLAATGRPKEHTPYLELARS
jgi:hypothetical protein